MFIFKLRNVFYLIPFLLLFSIPVIGMGKKERDISSLPKPVFEQKINDDITSLRIISTRIDSLKSFYDQFFKNLQLVENASFSVTERTTLKEAWALYMDMARVLQNIIVDHEKFHKLKGARRADSFLTGYAAYLMLYSAGLYIADHTMNVEHFEVLLDNEIPEYGIPAGQYGKLKWNVIHINDVSRVMDGYEAYRYLAGKHHITDASPGDRGWLIRIIERKFSFCQKKLTRNVASYFGLNTLDLLKDQALNLIFPLQKGIAELMGYTRLTAREGGLISKRQCKRLKYAARPGDLLMERKEWYLSNMGLPGFWSHAALYLGSKKELTEWSASPAVDNIYRQKDPDYTDFPSYLEKHYPKAWAEYCKGKKGKSYRIIEGMGPGIIFTTISGSVGKSDYATCLRPRLGKSDLAQAIEKAFGYWGRDYDFYFDFLSDDKLVCTELVYKCFEPAPGKAGLNIPLVRIMGTLTLPANNIVQQFDKEYETSPQLDFILYFAADEKETCALEQDVVAFRQSHYRPGWR